MPASVVRQWEREIRSITKEFEVWKYVAGTGTPGDHRNITGLLTEHEVLQGKDENSAAIILARKDVVFSRHGQSPWENKPGQLENGILGISRMEAERNNSSPEAEGPGNVRRCFHYVVFDEAHLLKNLLTQINWTTRMLDPHFTILVTGTPDPNNLVHDTEGYIPFIEPKASDIQHAVAGIDWEDWEDPQADINIYQDKDDSNKVVQLLRPTQAMFKKWIANPNVDEEAKVRKLPWRCSGKVKR